MKQSQTSAPWAGSLTPELEGAERSAPHPERAWEGEQPRETKKDGGRYE